MRLLHECRVSGYVSIGTDGESEVRPSSAAREQALAKHVPVVFHEVCRRGVSPATFHRRLEEPCQNHSQCVLVVIGDGTLELCFELGVNRVLGEHRLLRAVFKNLKA